MAKLNGELKIESGIPIPASRKGPHGDSISATLRRLSVGDSVLLPLSAKSPYKLALNILGAGNYTVRKAEDGYRIWRTK